MSDQPEKSDKTEEPTERKLREARRKGEAPSSREVAGFFILIGAALLALMYAQPGADALTSVLGQVVENAHAMSPASSKVDAQAIMAVVIEVLLIAIAPVLGVFVVAAIAAAFAQNAVVFAPNRLEAKLDRVSVAKGLKRLFSPDTGMEFLKGIIKITAAAGAALMVIRGELGRLSASSSFDVRDAPGVMGEAAVKVLLAVLVVTAVITVVDVLWRRQKFHQDQKMTRQELKDEMKSTEGNPEVKAKLASIRQEKARQRMMQAVPGASVVVANPTHYAVALKYEPGETPAPMCVAKGVDLTALKIREIAEDAGVPVVEEPPTARALYAAVEIDQIIPQDLFLAVAEILTRVQRAEDKAGG